MYNTRDGPRRRNVIVGVAQGSILGPDLWNVPYDGVLRIKLPVDAFIIGYADNIAAVVLVKHMDDAQMRRVIRWLEHGPDLSIEKTEIVLLTVKRIPTDVPGRGEADARREKQNRRGSLFCAAPFTSGAEYRSAGPRPFSASGRTPSRPFRLGLVLAKNGTTGS